MVGLNVCSGCHGGFGMPFALARCLPIASFSGAAGTRYGNGAAPIGEERFMQAKR
ncbi:hypothetical protein [Xanthomonas populi]|uniref:hypothetical protein n=1 Tax=Xanthomonas populi TaxID=53414 RepID=UPI001304C9A2|nr:hypothetical protein [Xanthomonas populi]